MSGPLRMAVVHKWEVPGNMIGKFTAEVGEKGEVAMIADVVVKVSGLLKMAVGTSGQRCLAN